MHARQVLKLADAGLHLNPKKCEFHRTETTYLGPVIGRDGIRMQPEKIEAVRVWKTPANLTDVRSFVGFANFYRRFIHGFSSVVQPLAELTRNGARFKWEREHASSGKGSSSWLSRNSRTALPLHPSSPTSTLNETS